MLLLSVSLACVSSAQVSEPELVAATTTAVTPQPAISTAAPAASLTPIQTYTPASFPSPHREFLLGSWLAADSGDRYVFQPQGEFAFSDAEQIVFGTYRFVSEDEIQVTFAGQAAAYTIWPIDNNSLFLNTADGRSIKLVRIR